MGAILRLTKKRLLIIGPAFRRNSSEEPLVAVERYDGVFFRIARKYLKQVRDVDVVVMVDDLDLVEGRSLLPYVPPKGDVWNKYSFPKNIIEAKERNEIFLRRKLKSGRYAEIFLAMSKKHVEALPDLSRYNIKVVFPVQALGPKAAALKEWLMAT